MKNNQLEILSALRYGKRLGAFEIMEKTGLWAGTVYPLLLDLEEQGKIASEWLPGPYPRKRVYWRVDL